MPTGAVVMTDEFWSSTVPLALTELAQLTLESE
jgi:hypothetical protein